MFLAHWLSGGVVGIGVSPGGVQSCVPSNGPSRTSEQMASSSAERSTSTGSSPSGVRHGVDSMERPGTLMTLACFRRVILQRNVMSLSDYGTDACVHKWETWGMDALVVCRKSFFLCTLVTIRLYPLSGLGTLLRTS